MSLNSNISIHDSAQRRRAFSLPELMISLVILGLGMLFIAAAIPVGLEYTRRTIDQSNGQAAGGYAHALLDSLTAVSPSLVQWQMSNSNKGFPERARVDRIVRPRDGGFLAQPTPELTATATYRPANLTYEPLMKVHAFVLGNIGASGAFRGTPHVDATETALTRYLFTLGAVLDVMNPFREIDPAVVAAPLRNVELLTPLPVVTRVFPPIEPVAPFRAIDFFNDNARYPQYGARGVGTVTTQEIDKAVDRRLAWTGFYRRVSYAPGSQSEYEFIVVVTRRPTLSHRFPQQDLLSGTIGDYQRPKAVTVGSRAIPGVLPGITGSDRIAPTPWLVVFDQIPALIPGVEYAYRYPGQAPPRGPRYLSVNPPFPERAKLRFKCSLQLGRLLPVGSILIPARNDETPTIMNPPGLKVHERNDTVGFVPSAPSSLPIYEVIERPDQYTVIVKGNGIYPWVRPTAVLPPNQLWPVWIIPPAFASRIGDRFDPIYENGSAVVAVVRRMVSLSEQK